MIQSELKHDSTGVANMLCNQITFIDPCCYYKLLYSWKIWRRFKFGGLAVGVETAKLKSPNIMLAAQAVRIASSS